MEEEAYVTLITNESYYHGAIALGISLCKTQTKRLKVVLVSPNVSKHLRQKLCCIWDLVLQVEVIDSHDLNNLSLIGRPELGVTFSKLHIWELVQFSKCVFLDADTLVLQNIDQLFLRSELSGAPDTGWPDCFNSGVFVFTPSIETYTNLMQLAGQVGSFDGADQGLLNTYWGNWANEQDKRLSFTFNVGINTSYFYNAAILKFKHDIKVLHYLGTSKPWLLPFYSSVENVPCIPQNVNTEFYAKWWQYYNEKEGYFQSHGSIYKTHEITDTSHETSDKTLETTDKTLETTDKTLETTDKTHETTHKTHEISDKSHETPDASIEPPSIELSEIPPDNTMVEPEHHDDVIITISDIEVNPLPPPTIDEIPLESLQIEGPGDVETEVDEKRWRLDWQEGHIEYLGRDASDIIIQNLVNKLK